MKKRILSILLTLCMVLCLVPTAAFAEADSDTMPKTLSGAIRPAATLIHLYAALRCQRRQRRAAKSERKKYGILCMGSHIRKNSNP